MQILLDTHILIWALSDPKKLSPKFTKIINDENNVVFISVATLWELQIKESIGKISLP